MAHFLPISIEVWGSVFSSIHWTYPRRNGFFVSAVTVLNPEYSAKPLANPLTKRRTNFLVLLDIYGDWVGLRGPSLTSITVSVHCYTGVDPDRPDHVMALSDNTLLSCAWRPEGHTVHQRHKAPIHVGRYKRILFLVHPRVIFNRPRLFFFLIYRIFNQAQVTLYCFPQNESSNATRRTIPLGYTRPNVFPYTSPSWDKGVSWL